MKHLKVGSTIRLFFENRWRHAHVVSLTDQDNVMARIGQYGPIMGTRAPGRQGAKGWFLDGPPHFGLDLFNRAQLWLSSRNGVAASQTLANAGVAGSALNAQMGYTSGVDSADPLLLPHTGEHYLYCPGTPRSGFDIVNSTPIGGSLRIRLDFAVTGGGESQQFLFNRWEGAIAPEMAFLFYIISNTGELGMYWRPADNPGGGEFHVETATVHVSSTADVRQQVEVELDLSVPGFVTVTFRSSPDGGATFVQLGSTITHAVASNQVRQAVGNYTIGYGGHTDDRIFKGTMYRAQVWDDGVLIIDVDPSQASAEDGLGFTSHGTVVNSASTSSRAPAVITEPTLMLVSDDLMSIPAHASMDTLTSGSFTLVGRIAVIRGGHNVILSNWGGTGTAGVMLSGYENLADRLYGQISDDTLAPAREGQAYTVGAAFTGMLIVNRVTQTMQTVINGVRGATVDITGVGSLTTAETWKIGYSATSPANGNIMMKHVAAFDWAFSDEDIVTAHDYLRGAIT